MAVIGCYDLNLYCDTGGDQYGGTCPAHQASGMRHRAPVHEFTGRTEAACIKLARKKGWTFERDPATGHYIKAFCPVCSKEKHH